MKEHVARKRFGQNFLVDSGIIAAIVSAIGPQKDQTLVEIGPGLGAITEPLMARLDHPVSYTHLTLPTSDLV